MIGRWAALGLAAVIAVGGCGPGASPSEAPASVAPTLRAIPSPTAGPPTIGGSWTRGPDLPEARSEHAAAALDGRIYVAGGFIRRATTNSFIALDLATSTWRALAPLPQPRDHTALVALGGAIYLIGGGILGRGVVAADVWRYDPASNAWTSVAPLPEGRSAHAAAAIDGRIVVAGGLVRGARPHVPTLIYDPATDAWAAAAAMPTDREHLAAVALSGALVAISGRWNSVTVGAVERFDLRSGMWSAEPSLPTPRGGLGAATLGGLIYVIGGEQVDPARTFRQVEVLDPVIGSWFEAPLLPKARHGFGPAVVVDGRLYVVGGGPNPDLSATAEVDVFTPAP